MPSTRASAKCKRLNNTTKKNKKFKASRSSSDKRSKSTTEPQPNTNSSITIHNHNIHVHDESSLEKESLVIDCPDESELDSGCISKNVANYDSKKLSIKTAPLNSTTITKHLIEENELNTETAYKKLAAVISICSPIVERISNTVDQNKFSSNNNGGSVVLDAEDQVTLPPPLSQITPTTNRINPPHSSRVNRSELRANQYLSPTTSARTNVNRPTTSSSCMSGSSSGFRHFGNNRSSNINLNTHGTPKNNVHFSVNTQSTSTNGRVTSQPNIPVQSINTAILDSIPEYRKLKKELTDEKQKCSGWYEDYMKLKEEFDKYRANSFPRPSVDGLNFLLQLLENLTVSSASIDKRTRGKLAEDIGLSEEELTHCSHPNPQRAALQVFIRLYPSYHERAQLNSIKIFSKKKSQLLDDIFIFARQCNPSIVYSIDKMRDAIGSSIRQAKHQIGRFNNLELDLEANYGEIGNENDIEQMNGKDVSIMEVQHQDFNNHHSRECSDDDLDCHMD